MSFNIKVQGGTRAGWRATSPTPKAWKCSCGRDNARFFVKCPDCGGNRDGSN